MSTQIDSGFVIPGAGLDKAYCLSVGFRRTVAEWTQRSTLEFYAKACARLIDDAAWYGTDTESPMVKVANDIRERRAEIRRSGRRDPEVDFDCSITFIPGPGAVYGLVFCEHPEMLDAWMRTPGVREYRYWDNTDPPSGIAPAHWRQRARTWDRLLGSDRIPSRVGITAECSAPVLHPSAEQVLKVMPSLADRASRIALDVAISARVRDIRSAGAAEPSAKSSSQGLIGAVIAAQKWTATTDGKRAVSALRDQVKAKLARRISAAMLEGA